jgi:hypothetical protein
MDCPNCGTRNDNDAQFCEKCGRPLKTFKKEGLSSTSKILLVACIVLVLALGLTAGMLLSKNDEVSVVNNTTTVNQTQPQITYQATWHEIQSYSGYSDDYMSFNTKGSKFKVVMSATPLASYNTNYMGIDISNTNNVLTSGSIDWTATESVNSKEKTIVVTSGPGTYWINVYTLDLDNWKVQVYDYY